MNRTGSIRSTVGPAVTRILLPERSRAAPERPPSAKSASRASTIASGSDIRPTSSSPQARWPDAGPTKRTPRDRSSAAFTRVAGWRHMAAFIAGAATTGAVTASSVVVSRSSAMPAAIFASALAVAGATTIASAHFASATCSISNLRSNASVYAGLPLSVSNVSGGTNSQACFVSTTRTCAPRFFRRLTRSHAL